MAVPVYIFCGFLESGKSSLIQTTLLDENFNEGEKTLLITCEEGIVEHDKHFLQKTNSDQVFISSTDQLSAQFFVNCDKTYRPDRVVIEWNGTWNIDELVNIEMPIDWVVVQILSVIDASTFTSYINNMRTFMFNIINPADVVIFNRCNDSMKKSYLRSNVKSINKAAQIIYEMEDGTINEMADDELPFDLNADVIEIQDDDYGLWYMDALDTPKKYEGKTIRIKGEVMRRNTDPDNIFVIGRKAMVCCADDVQLIGLMVQSENAEQMVDGDWLILEAYVSTVYDEEYEGMVPILTELDYRRVKPIPDDMVYFS